MVYHILDTSRYSIDENKLTIVDNTYIESGRSIICTLYIMIFMVMIAIFMASSSLYDISSNSGPWSIPIPYPFSEFNNKGNTMLISVGGHILSFLNMILLMIIQQIISYSQIYHY